MFIAILHAKVVNYNSAFNNQFAKTHKFSQFLLFIKSVTLVSGVREGKGEGGYNINAI